MPTLLSSSLLFLGLLSVVGVGQTHVTLTASPGSVDIAPSLPAAGWFFDGQLPGPLIRVNQGETLSVRFINQLPEESSIHWHGIPLPSGMDGVPGLSRPPVQPGQEFTYEFVCDTPGIYFYHPHVELQLDRGLYGVVIVDPVTTSDPPYDKEFVIVLDDLLSGAPILGQPPFYIHHLMNGKNSAGQTPLAVDFGDTVRLRFVNAAAGTNYAVAIDGHPMTVTHSDGRPVQPVTVDALPIGAGERYDVYVTCSNIGTWSIAAARLQSRSQTLVRAVLEYQGSTAPLPSPTFTPTNLATGALLSYAQLAHGGTPTPLAAVPDRIHPVVLSANLATYTWFINGASFPNPIPLMVEYGERVRLDMVNSAPMLHPMHLHGHFYRLLGTAGGTTSPPQKDTVLLGSPGIIPTGNSLQVEIVADNPGTWMYHCHDLYHAHSGMMTVLKYQNGDQDGDGLDDGFDLDPLSAYPVLTTDDQGGLFTNGTTLALKAQWPAGEMVTFFWGMELPSPARQGLVGNLSIWPVIELGTATAGAFDSASLAVAIPPLPALAGLRIPFQAIATHGSLTPGYRLSTVEFVTIQ